MESIAEQIPSLSVLVFLVIKFLTHLKDEGKETREVITNNTEAVIELKKQIENEISSKTK